MSEPITLTHLSFTRLKHLSHSPLALRRYIEEVFEPTAAMNEGTLLDCLLFEPHTFNDRFFILPADAPKRPTKAQVNAKKPSQETLEQMARWEAMEAKIKGRITITQATKDEAMYLHDCIADNATVVYHGLLNPELFKFQVDTRFFYNGFLHKGIKDADGHRRDGVRTIWDLKRMGAASGEMLVRSQIRKMKYDLQAAIYCHELDTAGETVKYYIVAVDNDGYVTPFEVTRDSRDKARIEWNKLIRAAHRLNMEGMDAGCEFWADGDGFFYF